MVSPSCTYGLKMDDAAQIERQCIYNIQPVERAEDFRHVTGNIWSFSAVDTELVIQCDFQAKTFRQTLSGSGEIFLRNGIFTLTHF